MRGKHSGPRPGRFDYGIVKKKAGQIIGRAGFRQQDRRDLEHSLLVRVLKALKEFNPRIGHRKALIAAVVERAVATLLRDAQAAKRDPRRIRSLQVVIDVAEGGVELCDVISDAAYNDRRLSHSRRPEDLALLTHDVANVLESLPEDLRLLAERLKNQSITDIAKEDGIRRTTLNDVVRRLRKPFEQAGLRDYLRNLPSPRAFTG